jgi:AmmeMemoRadiSam system protein A
MEIDDEGKGFLLSLARKSIRCAISRLQLEKEAAPEWTIEPKGAFVTIKIGGELRGCIGHMTAQESLYQTTIDMARAAALEDPRFPPLSQAELEASKLEISVLSPLSLIADPEEIEVGKHGVYIIAGYRSGVLLPQVATEWGWDRATFLRQACRKAGVQESVLGDPSTRVYSFEASVFGEA